MRIEDYIQALIAVLGLTALFSIPNSVKASANHSSQIFRFKRNKQHHIYEGWNEPFYQHDTHFHFPAGKYLTQRDNQMLLRQEYIDRNRTPVECCPSVLEMIEPDGGKNQYDQYVELYRDGDYRQRFYELSCHEEVLEKPCRFMDKKLHEHSRCVQKYSYTYALVKDPGRHHHHQRLKNFPSFPASGPGGITWTLDYIRVRSGCGCVVTPSNKKKRNDKNRKKRIKNEDVVR